MAKRVQNGIVDGLLHVTLQYVCLCCRNYFHVLKNIRSELRILVRYLIKLKVYKYLISVESCTRIYFECQNINCNLQRTLVCTTQKTSRNYFSELEHEQTKQLSWIVHVVRDFKDKSQNFPTIIPFSVFTASGHCRYVYVLFPL